MLFAAVEVAGAVGGTGTLEAGAVPVGRGIGVEVGARISDMQAVTSAAPAPRPAIFRNFLREYMLTCLAYFREARQASSKSASHSTFS